MEISDNLKYANKFRMYEIKDYRFLDFCGFDEKKSDIWIYVYDFDDDLSDGLNKIKGVYINTDICEFAVMEFERFGKNGIKNFMEFFNACTKYLYHKATKEGHIKIYRPIYKNFRYEGNGGNGGNEGNGTKGLFYHAEYISALGDRHTIIKRHKIHLPHSQIGKMLDFEKIQNSYKKTLKKYESLEKHQNFLETPLYNSEEYQALLDMFKKNVENIMQLLKEEVKR